MEAGLWDADEALSQGLVESINRQTLGQLLKNLDNQTQSLGELTDLLWKAVKERNRLFHSFFLKHDAKSEEGREAMLKNLSGIVTAIMRAYIVVFKLQGMDCDKEIARLKDELRIDPSIGLAR